MSTTSANSSSIRFLPSDEFEHRIRGLSRYAHPPEDTGEIIAIEKPDTGTRDDYGSRVRCLFKKPSGLLYYTYVESSTLPFLQIPLFDG